MVIAYILTFLSGSLFVAALEVLIVCYFFAKLHRGRSQPTGRPLSVNADGDSKITMEGDVWVIHLTSSQLQSAIKSQQSSKQPKDRKPKKEVDEFSIVPKDAKLENGVLSLSGADGVSCSINLEGSSIKAVSSSASANRKWAKKYPIKLEHKDRTLPETICLLYFKTGREKELWCQALRAAASREVEERYSSLKVEFRDYLTGLKENSPDIFKLSTSSWKNPAMVLRKSVSWKRLLRKKTSKADGAKAKTVSVQVEEPKPEDISRTNSLNAEEFENESGFSDANQEGSTNGKKGREAAPDTSGPEVPTTSRLEGSIPALNIIFSRLFFDLYHSSALVNHIRRRVQNVLTRISTPSYISPIICTGIDIGKAPPMIHGLRAVPLVDDLWGVEVDIAYTGGIVFTLETRLDLRESRSADNKVDASPGGTATADIISRSIQTVEDDLETSAESSEPAERNAGSSKGGSRKRWTQWKTFVASLADQVSQVPLVLSMRLVSLKGSLQFRIKSSPSDRIWYGFSSMPELELVPEPSVGERKITTGPLLSYIVERLQILVAETVVLPNCEDIYVPWMLADEDDWLQESSVPFPQAWPDAKALGKSKRDRKVPTSSEPAAPSGLKVPLLDNKRDDSDQDVEATKLLASSSDAAAAAGVEKKGRSSKRVLNFGKKFVEEKTRNFAEKMRERFEKE